MSESADMPYGIGSKVWPGLGKTVEELGELGELLGKIIGARGSLIHMWACDTCKGRGQVEHLSFPCRDCDGDGYLGSGDLTDALHDELSDVLAAVTFFVKTNDQIDDQRVWERAMSKLATFEGWRRDGVF